MGLGERHRRRQEIDAFGRLNNMYIVVDAKTANSPRGRARGVQTQLNIIMVIGTRLFRILKTDMKQSMGTGIAFLFFGQEGKRYAKSTKEWPRTLGLL